MTDKKRKPESTEIVPFDDFTANMGKAAIDAALKQIQKETTEKFVGHIAAIVKTKETLSSKRNRIDRAIEVCNLQINAISKGEIDVNTTKGTFAYRDKSLNVDPLEIAGWKTGLPSTVRALAEDPATDWYSGND